MGDTEINMKGNTFAFEQKVKGMISLGAFFVCTASALATQQFMMNYWRVLFFSGVSIVVVAIAISKGRKTLKKLGYVSGDKRYVRETKKLVGKKTKGTLPGLP